MTAPIHHPPGLTPPDVLAARLRALLARGGPTLLATDFDGTLAPIAAHPADAAGDPEALAALRALTRRGVITAVVSGRALDDLAARLGPDHGCILVVEHGAATRYPDGTLVTERVTADQARALDAVTAQAEAFAVAFPGAEVERKPTSVAVHYRNVVPLPREDLDEALAALVAEAHARGLHTLAGRAVIEVRPPIANKATGLSRVRDRVAPDAAVVYAGDDATDEPAPAFAARRGLAVYVASAERAHPRGIDGLLVTVQPAWCAALGALARDAE